MQISYQVRKNKWIKQMRDGRAGVSGHCQNPRQMAETTTCHSDIVPPLRAANRVMSRPSDCMIKFSLLRRASRTLVARRTRNGGASALPLPLRSVRYPDKTP